MTLKSERKQRCRLWHTQRLLWERERERQATSRSQRTEPSRQAKNTREIYSSANIRLVVCAFVCFCVFQLTHVWEEQIQRWVRNDRGTIQILQRVVKNILQLKTKLLAHMQTQAVSSLTGVQLYSNAKVISSAHTHTPVVSGDFFNRVCWVLRFWKRLTCSQNWGKKKSVQDINSWFWERKVRIESLYHEIMRNKSQNCEIKSCNTFFY